MKTRLTKEDLQAIRKRATRSTHEGEFMLVSAEEFNILAACYEPLIERRTAAEERLGHDLV